MKKFVGLALIIVLSLAIAGSVGAEMTVQEKVRIWVDDIWCGQDYQDYARGLVAQREPEGCEYKPFWLIRRQEVETWAERIVESVGDGPVFLGFHRSQTIYWDPRDDQFLVNDWDAQEAPGLLVKKNEEQNEERFDFWIFKCKNLVAGF